MLNRSASLAMSTSVLKALSGKLISKDTHLVFSFYNTVFMLTSQEAFSRSLFQIFQSCPATGM